MKRRLYLVLITCCFVMALINANADEPTLYQYAPDNVDYSDWSQYEVLLQKLLDHPIRSTYELKLWMRDRDELKSFSIAQRSRARINYSRQTDNPEYEAKRKHIIENIRPKLKPYQQKLDQKYINCEFRSSLDKDFYALFDKKLETDIKLFREENIPIQTETNLLSQRYMKINAAMTAEWDGEEKTLQQLDVFTIDPERSVREKAWKKITNRRLQDRDAMDEIYDEMLGKRDRIAKNCNFDNFRDYAFVSKKRFDYTPEDCFQLHNAIEKCVVPLARKLAQKQKKSLGVEILRPWDMKVDPQNRSPLKPFDKIEDLKNGVQRIFDRLDPEISAEFAEMNWRGNLDLESRKGKAPGGYCSNYMVTRSAFIFMNAAGIHQNVETLLHETGHAYHFCRASKLPLSHYWFAPLEFAEVASMTMELFGLDLLDEFYSGEYLNRAKREQLERIITFLPWMSRIDAFQHWIYTHPDQTREERSQAWLDLEERFDGRADWTGFEDAKAAEWHRQRHIFKAPFYYIEYGIAQLGALQIWKNYLENPEKALQQYKKALSLGGSQPLPVLFETAGAKFDFSIENIQPLMDLLEEELAKLPE